MDIADVGRTSPAGPVMLVASNGGHLAQLMALRPWWEERERVFVTFRTPDTITQLAAEQVEWAFHPTTRHVRNLARNLSLALSVVRDRRPSLVVSTGAAVALPFFLAARLRGIPTVYIEVYDRIDSTTLTGRLCRPFTNLFLVQWPQQQALYKGSEVLGRLL